MNQTIRLATAAPESWLLPRQESPVPGPLPLTPGLHLMFGPKASGKTLTSLGIAHWTRVSGGAASFSYLLEPRAIGSQSLLSGNRWEEHLDSLLSANKGGVVVVDSMTYVVAKLSTIKGMEAELTGVTYAGGLSPRDILGILLHDEKARLANVALIGTINSELFPVVEKLEGACEGQIQLTSPGTFTLRTRKDREINTFTLPDAARKLATRDLGYLDSTTRLGTMEII